MSLIVRIVASVSELRSVWSDQNVAEPGGTDHIRVVLPAQTTLGRPFTNAANLTLNLVEPGKLFGERLNQLDLRIAKLLRAGRTRTSVNFDLYNAFNASTVLAENATYSGAALNQWRVPTTVAVEYKPHGQTSYSNT